MTSKLAEPKKYKTWMMSQVIELECNSADEAIAISLLYFQASAPIAIYEWEKDLSIITKFPYDAKEIDKILSSMWPERIRECYNSISPLSQ